MLNGHDEADLFLFAAAYFFKRERARERDEGKWQKKERHSYSKTISPVLSSVCICLCLLIDRWLSWTLMPDVFNHLDNHASNSNKSNCLINLLVRPIQRDEHVDEEFGLFNDDEDNLTLLGKTMIKSGGN
jgi:hypothetical protein